MRRASTPKMPQKKKQVVPPCPKCGRKQAIKSGKVQNEQRWKCKSCAYQYTRSAPRGRPLWQKSLVVFLYSYGMSLHAIAKIFHVQPSTVLKWVRIYAQDYHHKPEAGDILMMGLNDMRQHLKKNTGQNAGTLCIAIDDVTFKKNLGITITKQ